MKQSNRARRQRSVIVWMWPRRHRTLLDIMREIEVRLGREPKPVQLDEFARALANRGGFGNVLKMPPGKPYDVAHVEASPAANAALQLGIRGAAD